MSGERPLLRLGEYLVGQACRRLPEDIREDRYREWAAELPAILHDPQIRLAPLRALRMLAYAADTVRGTARTPARARRQTSRETASLYLFIAIGLVAVAADIWATVQAPGHPQNYLQMAWSLLLLAYPIRVLARSADRLAVLIFIGSTSAGLAFSLWNVAEAPGDWVNYFSAASFALLLPVLLVAWWVLGRRPRTGPRNAARTAR